MLLIFCRRFNSTFLKRKGGLFKKAHELAVLCSVDVTVIIFGHNKKLYEFSSGDIRETLARYQYVRIPSLIFEVRIADFDGSTAHRMSTKVPQTLLARRSRKKKMTMRLLRRLMIMHAGLRPVAFPQGLQHNKPSST